MFNWFLAEAYIHGSGTKGLIVIILYQFIPMETETFYELFAAE